MPIPMSKWEAQKRKQQERKHKVIRHYWAMSSLCNYCARSYFCVDSTTKPQNENLFNVTDCTSYERRKD